MAAASTVMVFRFSNMQPAADLCTALAEIEVPAAITFARGTWEVHTDTRCLAHPNIVVLVAIVYRGGGR